MQHGRHATQHTPHQQPPGWCARCSRQRQQLALLQLAVALLQLLPASAASALAPTAAPAPAAAGWPRDAVYSDPWVSTHVALAYAPETTRDGLGAQAFRVLGIHALAHALGLRYLHRPPECVGHIGRLPHYQGRDCRPFLAPGDRHVLARVQRLLALPASVTEAEARSWHVERLDDVALTWELLANATRAAARLRRPTLIKLARVQALLCRHPDVFAALPALAPAPQPGSAAAWPKPWLLGSPRLAVHLRRGDITTNKGHSRRLLPVSFFIRVVTQLLQALQGAGQRDALVQVFTERPDGPAGRHDLVELRRAVPGVVLHVDTDHVWNWQQMASADLLVLSNSMYSTVPALLNPRALVVGPPSRGLDGSAMSVLRMRHWFTASNWDGALPPALLDAVRARFDAGAAAAPQAVV